MNKKLFHLDEHRLPFLAEALRALGHPLRLRLLEALATGEQPVGALVELLGVPQATVSQHLKIMRTSLLVTRRRLGTLALYSLAHDGLRSLLACLRTCQYSCPGTLAEADQTISRSTTST